MISDTNSNKPEINYPCKWDYKVIGNNLDEMIKLIESIVSGFEYEIKSSNVSSNGKYFSLNLNVLVNSEFMRDEIFAGLKSDEFILMVL